MPPKKSKTLRKSLNESNAERRWLGENVNFGVVLDGENEFVRAADTATDISSELVIADAATVQPPIASLTQPPCRAVPYLRKARLGRLSKGKFKLGHTNPPVEIGALLMWANSIKGNTVITDVCKGAKQASVTVLALGLERIHQVTNTIRIENTGWRIRYVSRIHFFSEAKLGNG